MRLISFILAIFFLLAFSNICLAGSPVIWKGDRASSLADGVEANKFFSIGTGGEGFFEYLSQSSDPAAPTSTELRLYSKDKQLYYRTADGITELVSGLGLSYDSGWNATEQSFPLVHGLGNFPTYQAFFYDNAGDIRLYPIGQYCDVGAANIDCEIDSILTLSPTQKYRIILGLGANAALVDIYDIHVNPAADISGSKIEDASISNDGVVTTISQSFAGQKTFINEIQATGMDSTATIFGPDGAVGTPSFTFRGDANTGMYSPTNGTTAFTSDGVQIGRFQSQGLIVETGQVFAQSGSVGNPSYAFEADADTGMYNSGTNSLRFATNGIFRLTLEGDGGVVIADTGGNGGNVPHNCRINNGGGTGASVSLACAAGEIVVGGGCTCAAGSQMSGSYPTSTTNWTCTFNPNCVAAIIINTICCDY